MTHNKTYRQCPKILVVDDEASIRFFLVEALTNDGYQVDSADCGEMALTCIAEQEYDLALLDLQMKTVSGMDVIAAIRRRWPDTVIVVLTAHASLETAVEALRHGAHDYLFKPCTMVDLRDSIHNGLQKHRYAARQRQLLTQLERNLSHNLAELRAVSSDIAAPEQDAPVGGQERAVPAAAAELPSDDATRFLNCCGLIVDITRHVITLEGHLLELSPTEFNVLAYLVSAAPRVISCEELVREVQGYAVETWQADEIVRYHIYRIRRKIKQATGLIDVVRTVRGIGYALKE